MKLPYGRITACLLLVLCLMTGCKDKAPAAPELYRVGEETAIPLDQVIGEGQGHLAAVAEPTEENPLRYTYYYEDVVQPAQLVTTYMEQLTSAEQGFVITDETNQQLEEPPDMEGDAGSLILEKAAAEAGQILQISLGWSEDRCTVQVSLPDGEIILLPEEEEEEQQQQEGKTLVEQLDYLYAKTPAELGLEESSMASYHIYPVEGFVMVDGNSCREFRVYSFEPPENTNTIVATYFLSGDLQELYRLEDETNRAVSLS